MKIDLHCRSKYSNDNYLEPDDLIRQAIIMKLDEVCFAERHFVAASLPVKNKNSGSISCVQGSWNINRPGASSCIWSER